MAVKDGSGPRPAPQPAKRRFLNCLETIASTLAFSCRPLGSEDRAAGFKHHGSEGRIGPAAGTPACQTSLSELPRNYSFNSCFFLPSARVRGPCRRPQTPWQWRTDRARGRHPSLPNVAFWTASPWQWRTDRARGRHPSLPNVAFWTACRQLGSEDPRTVPQASNTMAVKDGSGPRPAPQPAKRRFLNCLETIASTLAFSCRQLESEDPRTVPQASNTMAVKDGSGPRPAPQFWTA